MGHRRHIAGTSLLKDIYTGKSGSFPTDFTLLGNGKAIFSAFDDNGTSSQELWITDGTAAGTKLLKDVSTAVNGTGFFDIKAMGNGKAIFSGFDDVNGFALWITDGTEAGTLLINTDAFSSIPFRFNVLGNGKAFFQLQHDSLTDVWVTDGTTAGTVLVTALVPNSYSFSIFNITELGNGKVVFLASDNSEPNGGLWVTDGSAAGTTVLNSNINFLNSFGFTSLGNGMAIFAGYDDVNGQEVWVTDGTVAGTKLLMDIYLGANGSSLTDITVNQHRKFSTYQHPKVSSWFEEIRFFG